MPIPSSRSYTLLLVLHGGAANTERSKIPSELYAASHASNQTYLRGTYALLKNGFTALGAAIYTVSLIGDD